MPVALSLSGNHIGMLITPELSYVYCQCGLNYCFL
ncbi:MAG: hypothetical protein ACI9EB_001213 [Pseudomonas sp.]|jgi:hypothetical protein